MVYVVPSRDCSRGRCPNPETTDQLTDNWYIVRSTLRRSQKSSERDPRPRIQSDLIPNSRSGPCVPISLNSHTSPRMTCSSMGPISLPPRVLRAVTKARITQNSDPPNCKTRTTMSWYLNSKIQHAGAKLTIREHRFLPTPQHSQMISGTHSLFLHHSHLLR
jgi:hypothetical protein